MAQRNRATFVMAHYSDAPRYRGFLKRAIAGMFEQTDTNWQLVIVDDGSPRQEDRDYLCALEQERPGKIASLFQDANLGAGVCRNRGVTWAWERGSEIVLFHDADDVSHPRRLEMSRALIEDRHEIDFVYSTYVVVDEHERPVPRERITPLLVETLDSHQSGPPEGADAWIRIATESGFVTPMTTVAVRTALAMAHPFPSFRVSEDVHAWYRMSAGGGEFAYVPSIPQLYRVPQDVTGSSNYNRFGRREYLAQKIAVDTDGFLRATAIAVTRGTLQASAVPGLTGRFFRRLARTMTGEGLHDLAGDLLQKADALGAI